MSISAIGQRDLSYIETVNKKNIEDQDKRSAENLANARKWQIQLDDLKEMVAGYNMSKLPLAQTLVGDSVDMSA